MTRSTPEGLLTWAFARVRDDTRALASPLSAEDCALQSMPDASPVKWHLAHTTWFFETFVLRVAQPEIAPVDERFGFLFNSYYESLGPRHARPARGMLSRPSLDEVNAYRRAVDERMAALLQEPISAEIARRIELGLHHEQQHQELILTDVLHALAQNPTHPAYRPPAPPHELVSAPPATFVEGPTGVVAIGHRGSAFSFDNEGPRHRVFLEPYTLATRLGTNAEMLAFIDAGGYHEPRFWLAAGFDFVQREGLQAPLHWQCTDGVWQRFSLHGLVNVEAAAPVCHVSYFEADALARFLGARLPTEFEWEAFVAERPIEGNFADSGLLTPRPAGHRAQVFGDAWTWTSSAYAPYPGYAPEDGALGEYNGKFMVGQQVLRGGSCFTPKNHLRATYRNFFPPSARWQMTGVRLARSLSS